MPKVYIVGGGASYEAMFESMGWELTFSTENADLVQFTGGHDVSPHLYGEAPHPATASYRDRDETEEVIFAEAQSYGVACAGICRGAQFLNVMNGGKLYQHVEGHAIRHSHLCRSEMLGRSLHVTSTHHQMMIPASHGEVEGYVLGLATTKQSVIDGNIAYIKRDNVDVEVVYYEGTRSLCFQPHPEFYGAVSTRDYYFTLLEYYFDFTH